MRLRSSVSMYLGLLAACGLLVSSAAADKVPSRRAKHKPAAAQTKPADEPPAQAEPAKDEAWWPPGSQVGPAQVKLLDQATVDLPDGFVYLHKDATNTLMERLGNRKDERTVGGIFPKNVREAKYFMILEWEGVGYVKDDEADKLDAKEILESIREGTEEGNKFRAEKGLPPVSVVGWDEPPRYDKARRHMVWAIRGRSENGETVNFNTRLLGRAGFLAMNLICGPEQLAGLKPTVEDLLKRTQYVSGKRYADFVKGQDKIAEFGLAAMVIGGAALAGKVVKVGLLAKFGKLLLGLVLMLKKAIILVLIAIGALIKRLLGGGGGSGESEAGAASTTTADPASTAQPAADPAAASAAQATDGKGAQAAPAEPSVSTSASASGAASDAAPAAPDSDPNKPASQS